MGNGAFEIGIAETLLRLSSLEPHQVIHTVGETAKLAPSATPPKLPYQSCQLMAPTRESIWGASGQHHLSGKSHQNAAKQSTRQ